MVAGRIVFYVLGTGLVLVGWYGLYKTVQKRRQK